MLSPLCLLLLVRLGGYIVNLWAFNSYRIIGKLTDFLQFLEFSLRNTTVTSSTTVTRCSPLNLDQNETTSLTRWQLYV